ncbi:MAG: glycosyltransferase [Acidobacteria bacterium]|nr:glycosyltransferase [Acidobacteriota bacterium]
MKTVVILGPDFSPSSHPPALRVRFFASHLREFGWNPIVIATDPGYYETTIDPENERLLPSGLEVIRTAALPARVTRLFGLGDLGWRSLWHNWRALRRIIIERRPELLFLPTPPSPGLLLGRLAAYRYGIPYVVDLIDPIATDYYWRLPRAQRPPKWWLASRSGRWIERTALRRASHITAVDAAYADGALHRYPWLKSSDVSGIPYGAEPADFEYVRRNPRQNQIFNSDDGKLHCCYVGVVGPYLLPAVRALLGALRHGLDRDPELFGRVQLHFVGTSYTPEAAPKVLPMAREAGVAALVTERPSRVGYLDAIQLQLSADMLVALGSEEAHYTASKIFPYLLANRPLLAIFHEQSSVVRILRGTRAAEPITFQSSGDLAGATEHILQEWQRLLKSPHISTGGERMAAFQPYTARAMAEKLARVFQAVSCAPRAAAVSAAVGSLQ